MNTIEFLNLIVDNPNKALIFKFPNGQTIGKNYHITEVKHATINSVDCGGREDSWHETIIQLMEGSTLENKTEYLSTFKAKGIFKKVDRSFKFVENSILKFEYGNDQFHTAQLFVNHYETSDKELLINLDVVPTQCKAKDSCGIPAKTEINTKEENCCSSTSGCC